MTSREKKNKVIQQVIKPALKEAGFHSLRGTQAFSIHKEACTIAVNIQSSQFNSKATGFSFWLNIVVDTPDLSDEQLQDVTFFKSFTEACFLPHQGRLHPLRDIRGYVIDGYKNYKPMDTPYEEIQAIIANDMQQYIIPGLSQIDSIADYQECVALWQEESKSQFVRLVDYFSEAHMLTLPFQKDTWIGTVNMKELVEKKKTLCLTTDEILQNKSIYCKVRELSTHPQEDTWPLICMTLSTE